MKITLPQIFADLKNTSGELLLMVLGGRAPAPEWFSSLAWRGEVWAVDRGVETCRKCGIVPYRLIGDCDSAEPSSWQWAVDGGAPVFKYESDKDLTDFQLALDLAVQSGRSYCIAVTGAFGGRFDHLWSSVLSFLHRSDEYVPLLMADDREGLLVLKGEEELSLSFEKKPEALSLIPFSRECWGVSLRGVRWPLSDVVLEYRDPYSVSNRLADGLEAEVEVKNGLLGVYWEWAD